MRAMVNGEVVKVPGSAKARGVQFVEVKTDNILGRCYRCGRKAIYDAEHGVHVCARCEEWVV